MKKHLFLFFFYCLFFPSLAENGPNKDLPKKEITTEARQKSSPLENQKTSFFKRTGIANEVGYTYYRRGFGIITDNVVPIHIVKGLYVEPGLRFLAHKFNISHFFSIASAGIFNYRFEGIFLGLKTDLKYRFQLFENFGLEVGVGFNIGPEFSNIFSFYYNKMFSTISLTMMPDLILGVHVNFKRFLFQVSLEKLFPISLGYYDHHDNRIYHSGNYEEATFPVPVFQNLSGSFRMCFSAAALMVGVTYFF